MPLTADNQPTDNQQYSYILPTSVYIDRAKLLKILQARFNDNFKVEMRLNQYTISIPEKIDEGEMLRLYMAEVAAEKQKDRVYTLSVITAREERIWAKERKQYDL